MFKEILAISLLIGAGLTVIFVVIPALSPQGCIAEENFFSNSPRYIAWDQLWFQQTLRYRWVYTDTGGVRQTSSDYSSVDLARSGLSEILSDGAITEQQYRCGLQLVSGN